MSLPKQYHLATDLKGASVMHYRTIREAATWFRTQDPETALTETAIRRLVRTGTVPSIRIGRKYLVSLESLTNYLAGT